MVLAFGFLAALEFEQLAGAGDFFGQRLDTLRNRFKLDRDLSALATKCFCLRAGGCHFCLQALRFAIGSRHAFFGLRELVAQIGNRSDGLENRGARLLLLLLKFGK